MIVAEVCNTYRKKTIEHDFPEKTKEGCWLIFKVLNSIFISTFFFWKNAIIKSIIKITIIEIMTLYHSGTCAAKNNKVP